MNFLCPANHNATYFAMQSQSAKEKAPLGKRGVCDARAGGQTIAIPPTCKAVELVTHPGKSKIYFDGAAAN
jgi:hypothetical protein